MPPSTDSASKPDTTRARWVLVVIILVAFGLHLADPQWLSASQSASLAALALIAGGALWQVVRADDPSDRLLGFSLLVLAAVLLGLMPGLETADPPDAFRSIFMLVGPPAGMILAERWQRRTPRMKADSIATPDDSAT
ncbi:hypothetical protein ACFWQC_21320 [Nocardioides sp. NPDC058538]|uniref:hypothetical protein n=1 Tax=Nocardioides sp. NPDC058538 TaxID=3346542 RepID=UPI00365CE444